jgi:hypothetical protein
VLNRSRISSHSCEFDWSFQGQPYKALLCSVGANHCAFENVSRNVVDPDPHQTEMKDPDPHRTDKLDPDLDHFADDKSKCMEYELI